MYATLPKYPSLRDGKPYCNRCYGALFGPRGYGHGGVESHTFHHGQTGKVGQRECLCFMMLRFCVANNG
ncbi:hypothetical protein Y032_0367g25 [Ancylostoma ceylanicum]|uniref:LIM zinc-binding domain-containing protein n=1 Tax=Ancylostoma ceylanicum TaxID=53326 RepID=A0A016RVH3_9BILA|nr:hypothetical protein Y032_0367g25 [Ancylostoma ceylanicum]